MRQHPARPSVVAGVIGVALALLAALLVAGSAPGSAAPDRSGQVRIEVLSNRADLVSGGDVLVRITAPRTGRRTEGDAWPAGTCRGSSASARPSCSPACATAATCSSRARRVGPGATGW